MATKNYEIKTYFGRCRCCLNYGYLKSMWMEHFWEGTTEIYGTMLTECFDISWEHPMLLEQDQICDMCILRLRDAFQFKKQILMSQNDFLENVTEMDYQIKEENVYEEVLEAEHDIDNEEINIKDVEQDVKKEKDYEEIEYLDEEYLVDNKQSLEIENEQITDDVANKSEASDTEQPIPQRKRKWPRKLPKQDRRKTYRQYTEEDFRLCLEAVKSNKMTRSEAAKQYNVPAKTLAAKLRAGREDYECISNAARHSIEADCDTQNKISTDVTNKIELAKHRDNIRSILRCSNATPIRGQWNSDYLCCFCTKTYTDPADLKMHTLEEHRKLSYSFEVKSIDDHVVKLDITNLRCTVCFVEINNLEDLMLHLRIVHDMPVHNDIPNHILPFKFGTDELTCVKCTKTFTSFKFILKHMSQEHYGNYECNKCQRRYVNKSSLRVHSIRHQSAVFACTHCAMVFDSRTKMMEHETLSHIKENKISKCAYCDQTFVDAEGRTDHEVKIHGAIGPVFRCKACSKVFRNRLALISHVQNVHSLVQSHQCSECDMAFFNKNDLKKHAVAHTGLREFLCRVCYKWYSSKKGLKEHMRIHSNDRKYSCNVCEHTFVQKWTWKAHMRVKHAHACSKVI